MKKIYFIITLSFLAACAATNHQAPTLVKEKNSSLHSCPLVSSDKAPQLLWTNTMVNMPESVVFDKKTKALYVSNIVGSPIQKDNKGWISKISLKGKTLQEKFINNLNAPKGMRILQGQLFVSDIDQVLSYSLTGKSLDKVIIKEAKFLNDIAFYDGKVLVSDMLAGAIYNVGKKGSYSVLLDSRSLESPNGLLMKNDTLLVAAWGNDIQSDFSTPRPGRIIEVDLKTNALTPWTESSMGNLDGLEADGDVAVLVSDWMAGKVFHLKKSGECHTILEGIKGAADIGFDPLIRTLYVPAMLENKILAYKLPTF